MTLHDTLANCHNHAADFGCVCGACLSQAQQASAQAAALQQELSRAAPALEAAMRAEAEAGSAFADMAGPLLEQAGALRGRLEAAHAAAEATPASMRALDLVVPDLAHLSSRVRALPCVANGQPKACVWSPSTLVCLS